MGLLCVGEARLILKSYFTFEPDFVADDLEELVKEGTVLVVVQDLLLGVLAVFDVDDAHFQLGLDEHLIQFEQLFGRVGQLAQY